jgi:hypothetical protein
METKLENKLRNVQPEVKGLTDAILECMSPISCESEDATLVAIAIAAGLCHEVLRQEEEIIGAAWVEYPLLKHYRKECSYGAGLDPFLKTARGQLMARAVKAVEEARQQCRRQNANGVRAYNAWAALHVRVYEECSLNLGGAWLLRYIVDGKPLPPLTELPYLAELFGAKIRIRQGPKTAKKEQEKQGNIE